MKVCPRCSSKKFWSLSSGQRRCKSCALTRKLDKTYWQKTRIPPYWKGSLYYTDDWFAYAHLSIRGNHVVVRKEKGLPKGRDHLNGIEGFWSYAKHWLYQYRGVPKQYFHLYLKEIEWRFNHRNENLVKLLRKLLNQQIVKELI